MNKFKIILIAIFMLSVSSLRCQDTIVCPVSPEIRSDISIIELDCMDCETSIKGYVLATLTFRDSISPLIITEVELYDIVVLDSITRKVIYSTFNNIDNTDSFYPGMIDSIISKLQAGYFYIPDYSNRKYFARRNAIHVPFVIKRNDVPD